MGVGVGCLCLFHSVVFTEAAIVVVVVVVVAVAILLLPLLPLLSLLVHHPPPYPYPYPHPPKRRSSSFIQRGSNGIFIVLSLPRRSLARLHAMLTDGRAVSSS